MATAPEKVHEVGAVKPDGIRNVLHADIAIVVFSDKGSDAGDVLIASTWLTVVVVELGGFSWRELDREAHQRELDFELEHPVDIDVVLFVLVWPIEKEFGWQFEAEHFPRKKAS